MRERQAREEAERQAQAHADKLRMYEEETEKARKGKMTEAQQAVNKCIVEVLSKGKNKVWQHHDHYSSCQN